MEHKMPRLQRAKQFAPFDALTGLRKALLRREEEQITREKPVLLTEKEVFDEIKKDTGYSYI